MGLLNPGGLNEVDRMPVHIVDLTAEVMWSILKTVGGMEESTGSRVFQATVQHVNEV